MLYFKAAKLLRTITIRQERKKKNNYFCTTNSTIEEFSNLAESILCRAVNTIAVAKQLFLMKYSPKLLAVPLTERKCICKHDSALVWRAHFL